MDYIETVLGIKTQYQAWEHEAELPYFILDRYEIRQVTIDTIKTIFLYPKAELDQMASLKKQISRIQKLEALPVVIIMNSITRNRREYLISAKIPFIIPGKQLYLPFMGLLLQEQFQQNLKPVEQLQPSAQVLFFYYLYQKKKQLYVNEAVNALFFSGMTITRAVRQLEQTGLFTTKKDGVQKILTGKYEGRELFIKMQPYLSSPIRKKIYVNNQSAMQYAYSSGLSALSEKTMINPPNVKCYAVSGKNNRLSGTDILMDSTTQVEIELWKYDPGILSNDKTVDILSLIMSFENNTDERIEEAIEDLLNYMEEH